MKLWQKCPICNGVGTVSSGYYIKSGDCDWWVSGGGSETCLTCKGNGIIETPDNDVKIEISIKLEE